MQEVHQNKMLLTQMVTFFSEAIQENPHHTTALYYRGVALKLLGECDAALRDFKTVSELNSPYSKNCFFEIRASQKKDYRKIGMNPAILLPLKDRVKARECMMSELYAAVCAVSNIKLTSRI